MPEAAFVISGGQHYPLRELAVTIQHELELQGVPSSLHVGAFPPPRPGRVYVLMGPRGYLESEGRQLLPGDGLLRRTVFVCDDREPDIDAEDHLALLRRAGAVFALDQRSVIALHRAGVPARLLRPGYSRLLDRFDAQAERPIDVMFLGRHSPRRSRYLARGAGVLARRNCLLQISEPGPSRGDSSSFLAESRWPLLAQTKVLISLHRGDDRRFDWRGALDAIHAGAVVVTEHASAVAPLVPGEHLVTASADALPFVAEGLLRDEDRLARLRQQAYDRLRTWIPFALPVSVLRAALVELVGASASPPRSVRPQLPPATPSPAPSPEPAGLEAALRGELSQTRGQLRGLQSELQRLERASRSEPLPLPAVTLHHENLAWRGRRAVRVSVLIALSAGGGLEASLDSLVRSRQPDFELIVVDAGARQAALDAARRWLIDHPRLPARIIGGEAARVGTGAARNLGLDFARAPYCLIMDPGQAVHPRCLEVLTATADAIPEAAFVYPILAITPASSGSLTAGGEHLASYLGWQPERLHEGNPIDTPVMVRTTRLRELGGFTTDRRLAGHEDYDLWCRIAERGWSGQLVPQALGARAESASSHGPSGLIELSADARSALLEGAPGLLGGAFTAQISSGPRG